MEKKIMINIESLVKYQVIVANSGDSPKDIALQAVDALLMAVRSTEESLAKESDQETGE